MKTLFTTFILCISFLSYAQQLDTLYIIFQDSDKAVRGIEHIYLNNYDTSKYRRANHAFLLNDSKVGLYRTFVYFNKKSLPDNPIIHKPVSFLETVEYIDWDVYTKDFSLHEYHELVESLSTYDKVYFTDRSEIKDGMMKMYPVKEMKSRY